MLSAALGPDLREIWRLARTRHLPQLGSLSVICRTACTRFARWFEEEGAVSHPPGSVVGMHGEIVESAETRHGVTTYEAAVALAGVGIAKSELRSARWERIGAGVYRLRGTPPTWEQRVAALSLAAGPDAAASHRSAAGLLGLSGFGRAGIPEVTTPRARQHRAATGTVHRWRPFPAEHLTVIDGIVTTRVARTLVDLAGVLHPARTARAVDSCLGARMVTLGALHATFAGLAGRGRKGAAAMRAILNERGAGYVAPESELEALFLALVRDAGLPAPVRQLDAGSDDGWVGRVDVAFPPGKVVVELDGRAHHSSKSDRDADARRDAVLRASGWEHIERFGWTDVTVTPHAVLARLRVLLDPTFKQRTGAAQCHISH